MNRQARKSDPYIHLDGTTLEGGGQLLRLALSLSSLTCIPIHITDIRGKRGPISSPGKDGGLKPAHLAAATWLAKASAAETEGMVAKSKELKFRPTPPEKIATNNRGSKQQCAGNDYGQSGELWQNVYKDGRIIRRYSHIPLSTPGSIFLVLQAVLPPLLFGSATWLEGQDSPIPLRLKINGGTNVSKSPSIEYVSQVLFPMLSLKVGIPEIGTVLHKRGWSTGGTQIGSVIFDVTPFRRGDVLPNFDFQRRGEVTKVHVSILAPGVKARNTIRDNAIAQLLTLDPEIEILFPVDEDSRNEKRWYLLLVAETSGGCRLGRDWLYDLKTKGVKIEQTCENLVSKVIKDLKRELSHGGCVDEYMQDQLVVFQALANGRANIDSGKGDAFLHTQTARWVAEKILGVHFNESGSCQGVSFRVGETFQARNDNAEEIVENVRQLEI